MMVPVPVLVLSPLGLAWILTRKKRTLPTNEELQRRIHKGELDSLKDFTPHNAATDVLKTDKHFWECMGGYRGLLRKRENAVFCVQFCQRYVLDSKMDKKDVDYVSRRSFQIAFLIMASIPEQAFRLIWWGMPHYCARWIAYLYWEAATYTQMLNLEYGSGQLTV